MKLFSKTSPALLVFFGVFFVTLLFSAFTNHIWEDYFITYRSSKNLATGHGLVFNHGEKLHTFTSPLGVLLPAVCSLLTANRSDVGALWLFRIMCALALGGAAVFLLQTATILRYSGLVALFVVTWFGTDAKILDFSSNGMETAFMMLFLAYAFWAHLSPEPRQWRHLGLAWSGLMWTRPDSFVYVGLLAAGFWFFNEPAGSKRSRSELLAVYLKAGLLTTLLYAPWLAWAAWYYGTPVPHTIIAKGGIGDPHTLTGLLLTAVRLPYLAWTQSASLELAFLPSYYMIGDWPNTTIIASRVLATICALLWLVPKARLETRVASFAFFGAHVYLTYFPYFPFPWYLPSTTILGFICLGGVLAQAVGTVARANFARGVAISLASLFLALSLWSTVQVARQVKAQQTIVEEGNRRRIGEWLHEHAARGDTVFMEPLGYIGFYSGLKTYDFPGMSSSEMVRARKLVGNEWSVLIQYLQPIWLVLRPSEVERINRETPGLLRDAYQMAQEFNRLADVEKLETYGKRYLELDSRFTVYHRNRQLRHDAPYAEISSLYPSPMQNIEGFEMLMVHAPGVMVVRIPPDAKFVDGHYGFSPGADEGEPRTDGAVFRIELRSRDRSVTLLNEAVDPATLPEHRKVQHYHLALPADREADSALTFLTLPGNTTTKDWTHWSVPDFHAKP
ncbi:MAG: hypothetical protein HY302_15995 [Opitutae bacterium]|nr:hypothetical protein [Opitutae bacterium]